MLDGSARGGSLKGTPVEGCLRQFLGSWRLVAIPEGGMSVDFSVKATREHVDLQLEH